ncbi:MAG: T9SS type A sorting domain-containing protein [Bacteroidetes bacterium]|nr:T9SS type A sorting domain-containing protein [Bacteroidota bacterium]
MKRFLLLSVLIFMSTLLFAQNYPEVSIKDINFAPADSLIYYGGLNGEPMPSFVGDTVVVTGVVMNSPYFGAKPDSGLALRAGFPACYLQDTSNPEWGGILLRDPTASKDFAILDSGMIIKVKGVVLEYFTTTELDLISFEAADIVGIMDRPKPVKLTLDSLFSKGTNLPNYLAEKWEAAYVEFEDVQAIGEGVGYQTFKIQDENNIRLLVYDKGAHFRYNFKAPLPGTSIKKIRGYIETRTGSYGWFMINPVYPEDIEYGAITPPSISNVSRNIGVAKFNETVRLTATITDPDNTAEVKEVKLIYSHNDSALDSLDMTLSDAAAGTWTVDFPVYSDSTIVKYYIKAKDASNALSFSPTSYKTSPYFYLVLNRDIKIADVQYSPFGSGFSSLNNYSVTVSGVVTADTSDIEGDGGSIGPQIYIQDGNSPWSAIQIFGTEADPLKRGDKVSVTGLVNENFGVTRIGNLDSGVKVTKIASGVELPAPVLIKTKDIGTSIDGNIAAEKYEGMLVKVMDVTVVRENADGNAGPDQGSGGNRNYGEISVQDDSGSPMRLETQDGTHDYHNFWDTALENQPTRIIKDSKFNEIDGILFYSFSNYKLVPRKNDDFKGYTDVCEDCDNSVPSSYSINQNYPNPFNPSTKISYSIKEQGMVNLTIYNILGQQVMTLVNEVQFAGVHSVQFNASSLSSGMYLYKISVNDFYAVKKMMLVK